VREEEPTLGVARLRVQRRQDDTSFAKTQPEMKEVRSEIFLENSLDIFRLLCHL
jgi:hypothetical protein